MIDFAVPSDPEELLSKSTSGAYHAASAFDPRSVSSAKVAAAIEDFATTMSDQPANIFSCFDAGFSLARGFSALTDEQKYMLVGSLCSAPTELLREVERVIAAGDDQLEIRRAVTMTSYLMHLLIVAADDEASCKRSTTGKGGKKGSSSSSSSSGWVWSGRRSACVDAFAQLIAPPVAQLWAGSTPPPEFVNLFTKVGFKLLEDPAVAKDADARRSVFSLLGTAIKQFNQAFGATTSILHLLGHFEHLPGPLAELVVFLVDRYDGQAVVNELMHEIGRNDPREYAQDASGARNVATFLTELGEQSPAAVLRSSGVAVLLPHLDGESYPIRNAILSILTSIVCHMVATEGEEGDSHAESAAKTRAQFQEILEERIHDVSAYVRAKALQMWSRMATVRVRSSSSGDARSSPAPGDTDGASARFKSAIPRHRLPVIVALAASRLKDKSSLVRKDAIRLMTILLTRNPYGAELKLSEWSGNFEAAVRELDAMRPKPKPKPDAADGDAVEAGTPAKSDTGGSKSPGDGDESDGGNGSDSDMLIDDDADASAAANAEGGDGDETGSDSTSDADGPSPEFKKQVLLVTFFKEATFFIQQMQDVIPCACDLLGSANATDVKESVTFLETCQRFGFETAGTGIRKMLALVWSKEESVKETLVAAYTRLYLESARPEAVAKNLVQLTEGCNLGELTSLEELVLILKEKEMISDTVVDRLWAMFAMRGNATREQSVRALIILSMTARAEPEIVRAHSGQLVGIGFGERGSEDMALVRYTCKALQALAPPASSKEPTQLFDAADPLFERMADVIVTGRLEDVDGWHSAAEEIVNTIYMLSENPDRPASSIIAGLTKAVADAGGKPSSAQLARLVSVVGHVALKQLVHLERIEKELKRRTRVVEDQAASRKKKEKGGSDEDDIVGGAAATDEIAEEVARIAEETLVRGDGLLAQFAPLLLAICRNPGTHPDAGLRCAAVLALSKFMCVSQEFASEHLQLFFTIMQESPEPEIRANCVLAVGDLAFRFANLLEPWTDHMYSRLRDEHVTVRKNAVMVLTHLILNDMIRIRGQVSEMAVRLEDPDERVASLAHLFYHELSRKGNAIYNMLPDIISQLACGEDRLEPEKFKKIMGYLFAFITKGVHCVSLVEKLCYRFRTTEEVEQWRYFAHCLALLPFNDKSVKKLQSQIACFQNTLADPEVYECFVSIIAKAKKFASVDMKDAVAEFEERITEIHDKGTEDAAAASKAARAAKKVAKVRAKRGKKGAKQAAAPLTPRDENVPVDSDDAGGSDGAAEEEEGGDVSEPDALEEPTPAASRKGRGASKAKAKRSQRLIDSDSDDADDFLI